MSWYEREEWFEKLNQRKEIPQYYRFKGEERGHLSRGAQHWREGELEKAEEELKRAIEVKRDYAAAWYYLGEVYEKHKNWEDAENAYRRSNDFCPYDSRAGVNLFTILMEQQRGEEALDIGLEIVSVHPRAVLIWEPLAVIYLAFGDIEKAKECDGRARFLLKEVHPDRPDLWVTQLSRLREQDERVESMLRREQYTTKTCHQCGKEHSSPRRTCVRCGGPLE